MPSDLGDLVVTLHNRGINESNRLELRALVDMLNSFNDFKKNHSCNTDLAYARQLIAVTKLLDEAIQSPDALSSSHPITQNNLTCG